MSEKRLVLSAGGQQGVAYIGVVQALERHYNCRCLTQHYEYFEGTSAGAMTSFLLSLGFTSLELLLHYQRAPPYSPDMAKMGQSFGLSDMRNFASKVIADALVSRGLVRAGDHEAAERYTFAQHYQHTGKRLVVGITIIGEQEENGGCREFNASVSNSPEWPVLACLLSSMAVPPLFGPVSINTPQGTVYAVDGAVSNGFRFTYASDDTLGIVLKPERPPVLAKGFSPHSHSILQYMIFMCELHLFFVASRRGQDINTGNVITIQCSSAAGTIYQPDANAIQELINAGEQQTQHFFKEKQKHKSNAHLERLGDGVSRVAAGQDNGAGGRASESGPG
jgi:predicted acylesterase/phospholipase RssA